MVGPLLEDRTAVVTGGSSGIGRHIAERFAAEGARVVVTESGASGWLTGTAFS